MKNKLLFVALMIMLICALSSCGHSHQWNEWQTTKQATCTDSGIKTRTCEVCGESETIPTSANGHAFNNWSITSQATCLEYQKETRICSICSFKETRVGNTTGEHDFNSDDICTMCTAIKMSEAEKQLASKIAYIRRNDKIVYDAAEQQYILTFELLDKNENSINPPVLVDIRIVDSNNSVVYDNTVFVKTSDYDKNVATIKIKTSDFTKSHDNAITIIYKVYNKGFVSFSEYKYDTVFVNLPDLPLTYQGKYHNVLITNIKYDLRVYSDSAYLDIYLSGEILSCKSSVNYISYKFYDSDGYIVEDDGTYTDAHQTGDKFRNEKFTVPVEVGESYILVFDGQN